MHDESIVCNQNMIVLECTQTYTWTILNVKIVRSCFRDYDYAHYDKNVSPLTWEKLFGFPLKWSVVPVCLSLVMVSFVVIYLYRKFLVAPSESVIWQTFKITSVYYIYIWNGFYWTAIFHFQFMELSWCHNKKSGKSLYC